MDMESAHTAINECNSVGYATRKKCGPKSYENRKKCTLVGYENRKKCTPVGYETPLGQVCSSASQTTQTA